MSFDDNPKVDASSERSERSVQAVRRLLSQKSGFICREEVPDFGVDLSVELVVSGNASGHRFPVQIKSRKHLPRITAGAAELISHQFSTSRLGYLCRHPPAYGLVILFDDSSATAYFDFVDEICRRLSAEKGSNTWRQQESVRIHIPTGNQLNLSSVTQIHDTYRRRFEAHALLVKQHGLQFGIPVIGAERVRRDPKDPRSAIEHLEKYGAALINAREFQILMGLIENVPHGSLESSPKLACIAAVGFSFSGRLLDADYFIGKADRHRGELSDEECALLDVHRIAVDYQFGRTSASQAHS